MATQELKPGKYETLAQEQRYLLTSAIIWHLFLANAILKSILTVLCMQLHHNAWKLGEGFSAKMTKEELKLSPFLLHSGYSFNSLLKPG